MEIEAKDNSIQDRFEKLKNSIPDVGDILVPLGELTEAVVRRNIVKDREAVFVNACIDSKATGWFLCNQAVGLKCMIIPEHHVKIGTTIKKLKVIRKANSDKALICEVIE